MKTLTIKTKIILTNCLVLTLLIMLSLIVTRVLSHNSTVITKVNTLEYPSLALTANNLALLKEAFERFNVAVTLGDDELLTNNLKVKSQITSNLQSLLSHKPELSSQIASLNNKISQYFTHADTLAKTMINGNADMTKAAADAQRNNADYEKITAEFETLHTQNTTNLESSIQQLVEKNDSTVTLIQLACIISVLVTAIIAFLLVTGIKNDLQLITNKMKDIASGDGDLRVRLEYSKDDELKELVTYFNRFVENLHDNIRNVVINTDTLSNISNNLLEANSVAKTISEKQLAAMDEVASAVTQMTNVAADISSNAQDTAKAVSNAMALSHNGANTVHQTLESLELLVNDVQKTAGVVSELNDSTKSAESILLAINSIAEQTNLLALNAAIEAARAGEQGRGFAVVADEVRTLASRTQASTKEIQTVLEDLQAKANIAMNIIGESLTNAERCNQKSNEAEVTIKDVALNMSDVDQRNVLIAAATEEQGQTTREMESHLLNIQNMSQQTVNSLKQVDNMVQSIEKVKIQLTSITEQFKTH